MPAHDAAQPQDRPRVVAVRGRTDRRLVRSCLAPHDATKGVARFRPEKREQTDAEVGGRQPYLTDIQNGNPRKVPPGNDIGERRSLRERGSCGRVVLSSPIRFR
jgi:hypothetical protein